MGNTKWYSPRGLRSYNAMFNLSIGARGIGKTFSFKRDLLKKAFFTGHPFIYLRRTQNNINNLDKEKFFTEELLKQVFNGYEVVELQVSSRVTKIVFTFEEFNKEDKGKEHVMLITSSKIIIDGKIVCYMKALSTWGKLKGAEYDDVQDILFDEVLINKYSRERYLPNEVSALFELMSSVFRRRKGCKVWLLSNASEMQNPYFAFFKFTGDTSKRFWYMKDRGVLIEFPDNSMYDEEAEDFDPDDPFYKLIKGTNVYGSMVDNEFQTDVDKNIIGKAKGVKQYLNGFIVDNQLVSCYNLNGLMFVDTGADIKRQIYCLDIAQVEDGYVYLQKKGATAKAINRCYYANTLVYSSIQAKLSFMEVINHVV